MTTPLRPPIGLELHRSARAVSQAFDAAMAEAGASLPVWLTLLAVKTRGSANQREMAGVIGIQGATLTHHLNAMESQGLLTRRRAPDNRRIHQVELTPAGEALFMKLRGTAIAFDKRLRAGLDEARLAEFAAVLSAMRANVGD
ncbi:MarR family winged helix-turn-helix transcriptional regulator [Mesorhizobium sp. SP-1A]|uniref:MarR family winged helix-turn-helix transcriptional regulator n=1 Tax=Mesorhizobium sp. SP-1A TaxID=3077840 RepID=UPI0028F6CD98|nr:MarR family winged helix-turn-helix transcriptional regulator [Mesorhizobium sp. SP-1A]